MFSTLELDELRTAIKTYMSEYRYNHTLGVEKSAVSLGNVFLPKSIPELRAAALLHDITKEIAIDEQLKLLYLSGFSLTDEDIATLPALHSFSAVPLIKNKFPYFATDNILSSVAHHTLGAEDISLFDKIIFLSDYIEDGRMHDNCIKTAEFVRNNIKPEKTLEENIKYLNQAIVMAVDFTIATVIKRNEKPHSLTLAMKSSLLR